MFCKSQGFSLSPRSDRHTTASRVLTGGRVSRVNAGSCSSHKVSTAIKFITNCRNNLGTACCVLAAKCKGLFRKTEKGGVWGDLPRWGRCHEVTERLTDRPEPPPCRGLGAQPPRLGGSRGVRQHPPTPRARACPHKVKLQLRYYETKSERGAILLEKQKKQRGIKKGSFRPPFFKLPVTCICACTG